MDTQTLDIPVVWPEYFGDCDSCAERLTQTLQGLAGVVDVSLNSDGHTIEVTYDTDLLTFEEIRERARLLGVDVAERYKHETVRVSGMDCPDCALKLETAVRRIRGVVWASVNYATQAVMIEFDPRQSSIDDVKTRIRGFGYDVDGETRTARGLGQVWTIRRVRACLTALSGALMAAGGTAALANAQEAAAWLFIASAVSGGVFAARAGLLSLRGLSLDTNFLMTIAACGAIALGEHWEAAAVMFLFSLGSTLEAHTVDRARRSIRSLMEAAPRSATVRRGGGLIDVALEDILVGETVIIRPGDRIAVDGTVVEGSSAVDEAPVTGEPVPKDKVCGDPVYAGSVNGHGALEVRVAAAAEDNTLARIVHMVEEAQAQKAPSQRFSEAFGRVYTPVVIGLAAMIALFGQPVFGGLYTDWVKSALTLLVVSCPCALVISTPVAIVAAIGRAARSGVLIKGGAHLETLGRVSVAAFDKTGTLTTGRLSVCGAVAFDSHSIEEVFSAAASVESRSEHPLAEAILEEARRIGAMLGDVAYFEAFPGKGARAVVNGRVLYVGSRRMLDERGIDSEAAQTALEPLLARGCTVVYVCDDRELLGAIAAGDTIKPAASGALAALRREGIRKTVLLTGDTAQAGSAVARELGIDEAYCELLPEDKLAMVRSLSRGEGSSRRDVVAMVGDGINDAPALAAAHVGIAMGGAGTPAAVEAADVALMADDIVMLPYAVSLSRRARRIIRQNVAFALGVVLLLVLGALFKKVNLATGVLGHEGSALLVIANSIRLLADGGPTARKP